MTQLQRPRSSIAVALWRPLKYAQSLTKIVIPAKAGIQTCQWYARRQIPKRKLYQRLPWLIGRAKHGFGWIPAFAGMTRSEPVCIFFQRSTSAAGSHPR